MSRRPWMPLYIADYLKDTRRLTTVEHGAYILLIMEYWTYGGLPDDDDRLRLITGMSAAEWRRSRSALQSFFFDGWRHKRLDAELARSEEISRKRSASAKIMHANAGAKVVPLHPHAGASTSQSQSQSPKKKGANAPSARAKPVKIPMPSDFILTSARKQYAFDHGADDPDVVGRWFRMFCSRSRKNADTAVDWDCAWQESCDRQIGWAQEAKLREPHTPRQNYVREDGCAAYLE